MIAAAAFSADLVCESRCIDDGALKTHRRQPTYSAPERGLKPGNGGFWGALGVNLDAWGREHCLQAAIERCGKIEAVADFRVAEFSSGAWQMAVPLDCTPPKKDLLSPFGARVGAIESKLPLSEAPAELRTSLVGKKLTTETEASCEFPIPTTLCGGDCLSSSDVQTLATTEPSVMQKPKVCGDTFVAAFKGKKLSPAVLQHYCTAYLVNTLLAPTRGPGLHNCAASRLSGDCSKAIEALTK